MDQQFLISKEHKRPINKETILIKKTKNKEFESINDDFAEINYQNMIDVLDNKFNLMIRKHKADPKKYKITKKDVMTFISDKVANINELDDY